MSDNIPVICTFESRRATEMRSLIQRFGGQAVSAPSMQEVPVEENQEAVSAIRRLVSGDVDYLILLTGVGTEAMLDVAEKYQLRQPLLDAMARIPLLIRGPKPAAVLHRLDLKYTVKAAEPNTWRELLKGIDEAGIVLKGRTVAIQEYGIANPDLYAGLSESGANVVPIPVYRWALPDDIEPLQTAIWQTIAGDIDGLLFTSAQQVRHVLMVADRMQLADEWRRAVLSIVIGSIGPTCSDALREEGLEVTVEASPPKMGPLVRAVLQQFSGAA